MNHTEHAHKLGQEYLVERLNKDSQNE